MQVQPQTVPPLVAAMPNSLLYAGTFWDYVALLKPRVMSLVIFTGYVGMVVAERTTSVQVHPFLAFVALLCIAIGAGASAAINMWFDRDIDAVMERTQKRPIPMGKIAPSDALGLGVVLSIFSVMILGLALNWLAAGLLALAIIWYVGLYTLWLKRASDQNIVIGGLAGALPPMIGWAAITGSISIMPCLMVAIIFFWTPPHFWALCLNRWPEYAKAGVPMLPSSKGIPATKWQMLAYTIILLPLVAMPWVLGVSGIVYGIGSFILGLGFTASSIWVLAEKNVTRYSKRASKMFAYSIFYLFGIFGLLWIDTLFQGL